VRSLIKCAKQLLRRCSRTTSTATPSWTVRAGAWRRCVREKGFSIIFVCVCECVCVCMSNNFGCNSFLDCTHEGMTQMREGKGV